MDITLKINTAEKMKLPRGTKITAFFIRKKTRKQMKDTYDIEKDKKLKETLLIDEVLEAENE